MKIRLLIMLMIALSMTKVVHAQIDYQTGSAVYSIPVFDYADPRSGLSHSISINYNSGQGIRVNQIASNIGLGWSLGCGGEIIRMQNGEPDDQYNPEPIVNNMTTEQAEQHIYEHNNKALYDKYYPNGYLYKKYDIDYPSKQLSYIPVFSKSASSKKYKTAPMAGEDTEQDYFSLSLNGQSKQFVIGRNGEVKYADGSLLKTELIREDINDRTLYNQGIITKIKGFVITDEDGIQYRFEKYDYEELMETTVVDESLNLHCIHDGVDYGSVYHGSQHAHVPMGKYIITRWVLTSIVHPQTNSTITFEYKAEEWKYRNSSYSYVSVSAPVSAHNILHTKMHRFSQVPLRVVFPANQTVDFIYSNAIRKDLYGASALKGILVKTNSVILKEYKINNGYFYEKRFLDDDGVNPNIYNLYTMPDKIACYDGEVELFNAYKYRLGLKNITVTVGNSSESSTIKLDYYNPIQTANNTFEMRSTFGTTWRSADYSGLNHPLLKNNCVSRNGEAEDQLNPYRYTADSSGVKIGLLKSIQVDNNQRLDYEYTYRKLDIVPRTAVLVSKITTTDLVNNTSYTKAYEYSDRKGYADAVYIDDTKNGHNHIKLRTYKVYGSPNSDEVGGQDVYGTVYAMAYNTIQSTIDQYISNSTTFSAVVNLFMKVLFPTGNKITSTENKEISNIPIVELQPNPSILRNVWEYDVLNGIPYKAAYYQYSYGRVGNEIKPFAFPYSAKQSIAPEKIGQLLSEINYDRDGNEVYRKEYAYQHKESLMDNNFRSVKNNAVDYGLVRGAINLNPPGTILNKAVSESYSFITGRSYLTLQSETVYNSGRTKTANSESDYSYNEKNHQVAISYALSSDGRLQGQAIRYAIDFWDTYTGNDVLQKLKQANKVNDPCTTLSWYRDNDGRYYINGISIIDYDPVSLKPSLTKQYRIAAPIPVNYGDINSFDPYNLPAWCTSLPYDIAERIVYQDGMPVEIWADNNTSVSTILYDKQTRLPVATIANAILSDVAYTSFEGNDNNGWEYTALNYPDAGTPTGGNSGQLGGTATLTHNGLNTGKSYRITLWAASDNCSYVRVNGQSGKTLVTAKGWTLLEFILSNATVATITATGGVRIDEVRLTPVNARMSSVTYDPLTRLKTTECDAGNRIARYEYDARGRVIFLRDENGNVLKTYEYNTKK